MRRLLTYMTNIILPSTCKECGIIIPSTDSLCPECITHISFLPNPIIAYFPLRPVFKKAIFYQSSEIKLKPALPLYYPSVEIYSAIFYAGIGKKLVSQLKYNGQLELAKTMSDWLDKLHKDIFAQHDLILPIPLHRWRFMQRGFNQAAEIARLLSRKHKINFHPEILTRSQYTSAQTRFNRRKRFENIKNAFSVKPSYASKIHGKKLLLVDDVYTTGATTQAACTELFNYKPQKITIMTFARTPLY